MSSAETGFGQGVPRAINAEESKVPQGHQDPRGLEELAPESIHPSEGEKGKSHATGKSIVPQKLQEFVPESVERALPNAIHDTSGLLPKKH